VILRYRLVPLLLAASCAVAPGLVTRADAQVSAAGAVAPANGVGTAFELAFWQSVSGSSDPAMFAAYLDQYPAGTFAGLARAKIAAMRRTDPVAVSAVASPAAAAPQIAPAAATTEMKLIPAVVAPFAVQAAPAPAVQPAPSILGNASLLAALAQSQVTGNALAAAKAPALPARPIMATVPTLTIPDHFCSAEARNQYHDTVYKPAMAVAAANNESAIGYLQALDAQYHAFGAQSDAAGMNAMAAGSRSYQPVASEAFATSNAYLHLFERIMAAPIKACRS
jgi:hypothetical protein